MSRSKETTDQAISVLEASFERALERANTQYRELLDRRMETLQLNIQEAIQPDIARLKQASEEIGNLSESLFASGLLISERQLSGIEAKASEAWVVTLDLYNDTEPGPIQEAVRANLLTGKRYTYFLPDHRTDEGRNAFMRRCRHELEFSRWRNSITYIEFSGDVLFLSSEVVIHNPPPLFRPKESYSGVPEAFTYARRKHPGSGSVYVRVDPDALKAMLRVLQRAYMELALPSVATSVLREFQGRVGSAGALIFAQWMNPEHPAIDQPDLDRLTEAVMLAQDLEEREREQIIYRFRQFLPAAEPGKNKRMENVRDAKD